MELIEGIKTRRSIRAFKDTQIPRETLERVFQAAANSSSYTNTQPWEAAIVCGEKRNELSQFLCDLVRNEGEIHPDVPRPKTWPPKQAEFSRNHGIRRLAVLGIDRNDEEGRKSLLLSNYEFFNGPCAIFLFMDSSLTEWSTFDMGLFAQNLILALHACGLGSCLQASVTNYAREIKQFLGISETKKMIVGISVGYPDHEAKFNAYRAIKQKPEEFTKWYT